MKLVYLGGGMGQKVGEAITFVNGYIVELEISAVMDTILEGLEVCPQKKFSTCLNNTDL